MRTFKILMVLGLVSFGNVGFAASGKAEKQVGLGFGVASTPSYSTFRVVGVLEGTYRTKFLGLSILATATSSERINGTFWFGEQGAYQQTFVEPRLYLAIFKFGVSVGLNLSSGSWGEIQSVVSYGAMGGIEIPFKSFSIGWDTRYLFPTSTNPAPLSTVMMFRFKL